MENRIGFGARLGAFLIDCVLASVIAFIVGPAVGGLLGATAGAAATSATAASNEQLSAILSGAITGAVLGAFTVFLAYGAVEALTGWTLGKRILGIQIGNQDGTPAAPGQLLGRWLLKNCGFISGVVTGLTGIALINRIGSFGSFAIFIGFFFIFASARQGFHDMIAKTAVYPRKQLQEV